MLLADLEASGNFDAIAPYRYDQIRIGDDVNGVIGTDLDATDELFDLGLTAGELTAGSDVVAIHEDPPGAPIGIHV